MTRVVRKPDYAVVGPEKVAISGFGGLTIRFAREPEAPLVAVAVEGAASVTIMPIGDVAQYVSDVLEAWRDDAPAALAEEASQLEGRLEAARSELLSWTRFEASEE